MKPLMIHVERAVHPVIAERSTKYQMREELYAHLLSIYEQEREQSADDETAIASACKWFGEPSALTAELQQTVNCLERAVIPIEQWVYRRKHETVIRHTCRIVATFFLYYTILIVVTVGIHQLLAIAGLDPSGGRGAWLTAIKVRVIIAMGCWFVVNVAIFTMIGHAMCRQLETGILRPRSWLVTGGLFATATFTAFGSGLGFLLIMPIDPGLIPTLLPRWQLLTVIAPLGFVAVSRLVAIAMVRSRPWESLVIDG